ncbi:Non-LTR retroelement reverse transcriptase [Sesbania bispinosa]|nr:Non-LTR retroelement reverse transcriptase [Sesbania bispinosa]
MDAENPSQPADSPYGPWMLVKKQARKKQIPMDKPRKQNSMQDIQESGSSFSLLTDNES